MNSDYSSFHMWVRDHLSPGSTVLELGSGEGTKLLTDMFSVYSVEHDPKYVGLVEGTTYIYAPLERNGKVLWYNRNCLSRELSKIYYDLLIIDGPTGKTGRNPIASNLDLFSWSCPVIVDDVNRRPEWKLFTALRDNESLGFHYSEVFQSTGKRFGVLY